MTPTCLGYTRGNTQEEELPRIYYKDIRTNAQMNDVLQYIV
jgi:hypothetical protein